MASTFPIKRINFFGRATKICMQNANGPCPLLAIANVLSLRNELKLPSGLREISQVREADSLHMLSLLLILNLKWCQPPAQL